MLINAAVTHAYAAPFQIEPVDLAEPKAGEMLVKIAACGVCHTDEAAQYEQVPTKLPAVLGHEGAGVVAPMGCGIQTGAGTVLNRLRPEFGSSLAVFGCGAVGMSAIMAAKITGCAKIIGVGGNENSLNLAMEVGATHVINRKKCQDIVSEIQAITGGGANYAIDTSGVTDFVRKGLHCLAPLGVLAVVGITSSMEIDMFGELIAEGKTITGVIEGDATPKLFIPKMLEYHRQGRFPVDRIMKFYSLSQINQAFADSHSGIAMKAVLRME